MHILGFGDPDLRSDSCEYSVIYTKWSSSNRRFEAKRIRGKRDFSLTFHIPGVSPWISAASKNLSKNRTFLSGKNCIVLKEKKKKDPDQLELQKDLTVLLSNAFETITKHFNSLHGIMIMNFSILFFKTYIMFYVPAYQQIDLIMYSRVHSFV